MLKKSSSVIAVLFLSHISISPFVRAEEAPAEPKKAWSESAELSVVSANGNTKSTTSSAKNTFIYNWTRTILELVAGGLGSRNDGHTIAEQYNAHEKVSFKVSDRNYLFEKVGWDKNRFAGIDNRYDSSVGAGREIWKTPKNDWLVELGGGYISEERTVGPRNDFGSGRFYTKYVHTISPTANFSQDGEYLINVEDDADYRAKTETALTAAMSTHLSLKVSYKWMHVGRPPVGFHKNDTLTTVGLLVNY